MNNTPHIDRETIYHKLYLLAGFVAHMGSQEHYHEFEDPHFYGMYSLLVGIAEEIYPECREKREAGHE